MLHWHVTQEVTEKRAWLQFGDGFGISQWVVSNWDVDHLFFLSFYLSLLFITIFIIFYFVSVVVVLSSQPIWVLFFSPDSLPHTPGWRGSGQEAGGAWLLPGVKLQHLIISPEWNRLPNSNIPLKDIQSCFDDSSGKYSNYCQLILSQNTKLWKIKA